MLQILHVDAADDVQRELGREPLVLSVKDWLKGYAKNLAKRYKREGRHGLCDYAVDLPDGRSIRANVYSSGDEYWVRFVQIDRS